MSLKRGETMVFRALKRTAVILMVARFLDKPVGESDIAAILDISPKTARSHLRSLAALGFLTRLQYHQGYQLTHAGRQMALPLEPVEAQPEPALLPACDPAGLSGDPSPEGPHPVDQRGTPGHDNHAGPRTRDNSPGEEEPSRLGLLDPREKLAPEPGNLPGSFNNISNNKEDSLNESIISINNHPGVIPGSAGARQDHTGSTPREDLEDRAEGLPHVDLGPPGVPPPDGAVPDPQEQNKFPPNDPRMVAGALATVGVVLNARTRKLLGRITTDDVEAVYRDLCRKRKGSETGLIVYMLEKIADPEQPHLEFPENPWGYQRALEREPAEDDLEDAEGCESQAVELAFDGPTAVRCAWDTALELVRQDLSKADVETWLVPAVPLAWDAQREVLTVGAASSFARDWLEERARVFITPFLAGILKSKSVSVEFVVY